MHIIPWICERSLRAALLVKQKLYYLAFNRNQSISCLFADCCSHDPTWSCMGNRCYKRLDEQQTQPECMEACCREGAYLTSISNKTESDFVYALL